MSRRVRIVACASALILVAGVVPLLRSDPRDPPSPPKFPARYGVHGIDVSHHAGAIDWQQVANAGVHFAWLKASEGGDHRDQRFTANSQGAHEAGLLVGPYHFFTFCRPGAEQARHFLEVIARAPRTLPVAVDVESVGNCANPPDARVIREQLGAFVEAVEGALGERLVIYSIAGEADALLQGLDRPRWLRSIGREPTERWSFWQVDPSARVPGISGPVDLDVFAGERADLERLRAR